MVLARRLHAEVVRPILLSADPDLRYAAALFGPGSEVLGFDDQQSTDHGWGPRLVVLVPRGSDPQPLRRTLDERLPDTFLGLDMSCGGPAFPNGVAKHQVGVFDTGFISVLLGFDPAAEITLDDWLLTPSQVLLEVTAGAVFHDDIGFEALRGRLAWYPHDVWLYLLASQWHRIAQEIAFPPRAAMVGDQFGARLVAARLVRDLVRLAFLIERRYAPYSKWLGAAFTRLGCAERLGPSLRRVLDELEWEDRHDALLEACEIAAALQDDLQIAPRVDARRQRFHTRPFDVIDADAVSDLLLAAVSDPEVRALGQPCGSVDQFADSTDVLGGRARQLREALRPSVSRRS